MRTSFSIACVLLIFFNIHGYYAVLWGVLQNHAQRVEAALDSGTYDTAETIMLRIPVTVPYATDDREFERAEGVIFHAGSYYRLIKQRLTMDTLFLECFKDIRETHIRQELSRHAQGLSDVAGRGKSASLLIGSTSEYYSISFCIEHTSHGWVNTLARKAICTLSSAKHSLAPQQPPERS